MKKIILLIISAVAYSSIAQNINIPDANFKAALVSNRDINTNGDSEISESEALLTKSLDLYNKGISDLTGIEYFTEITQLFCEKNQLTSLDISNNKLLKFLYCSNNLITSLDVSHNNALREFYCSNNKLTSLSVSNHVSLTLFDCSYNQLTSIDVSSNTALGDFICNDNQLTSVDVSKNTVLSFFSCSNNLLTSLDISKNITLNEFYCTNNPGLTCIKVQDNFIPKSYWEKDALVTYSSTCGVVSGIVFSKEQEVLSIYPNPATSTIYLKEGKVQIVDQIGNLVIDAKSYGQVDVSSLDAGIYFVIREAEKAKLIIE